LQDIFQRCQLKDWGTETLKCQKGIQFWFLFQFIYYESNTVFLSFLLNH
jgi:hypothetical protein